MRYTKSSSYITVTDQFCGAGGSSLGASAALGTGGQILLAMNHWKLAVETHNTNFPNALHDCTDILALRHACEQELPLRVRECLGVTAYTDGWFDGGRHVSLTIGAATWIVRQSAEQEGFRVLAPGSRLAESGVFVRCGDLASFIGDAPSRKAHSPPCMAVRCNPGWRESAQRGGYAQRNAALGAYACSPCAPPDSWCPIACAG